MTPPAQRNFCPHWNWDCIVQKAQDVQGNTCVGKPLSILGINCRRYGIYETIHVEADDKHRDCPCNHSEPWPVDDVGGVANTHVAYIPDAIHVNWAWAHHHNQSRKHTYRSTALPMMLGVHANRNKGIMA